MDTDSWLTASHAEDLSFMANNSGFDVLSSQSTFSIESGLCDQSALICEFEQPTKIPVQSITQPTPYQLFDDGLPLPYHQDTGAIKNQLFDDGLPLPHHQDTGALNSSPMYSSDTVFSPFSGSLSDTSSSSDLLSSPYSDTSFSGLWNLAPENNFAPGRKESMDTLISEWGWSQADTSSLPELTPSSPDDADRNMMSMAAPPPLQPDSVSASAQSPVTHAAIMSRVIRIETDRRFSDAGYIPPVSHSSAAATQRVLSLLGCLQPVIPDQVMPVWPLQQEHPPDTLKQSEIAAPTAATSAIMAVPSKKRKAVDIIQSSFDFETRQPNKKREYLDYFSFYKAQPEQCIPAVESLNVPSEPPSSTQDTSTSTNFTKRRRRLTESERKRNRVLSEKQRREELKGRLDEICSMIPGLHSNLGTKSLVLQQVADWLENLLLENKALQTYLNNLTRC
ncbi:hypothetical protein KEM54_003880 [Ascosphaera aggregata]|nr:hypothetical protein KEM54_003880 [Ascosphaera aggregata]